jgi:SRSO17 transposase
VPTRSATICGYVIEQLGETDGVLIVDETGFLKKGTKSVGVKRQYSGTAGRIENCQVGVFLAYRSKRGHALIDRALYLPREWSDDVTRREEAKVPESIAFATKQTLARAMMERVLNAQTPCAWLTADEAYGTDCKFRRLCQEKRLNYVVAISSATHLYLEGKRRAVGKQGIRDPNVEQALGLVVRAVYGHPHPSCSLRRSTRRTVFLQDKPDTYS